MIKKHFFQSYAFLNLYSFVFFIGIVTLILIPRLGTSDSEQGNEGDRGRDVDATVVHSAPCPEVVAPPQPLTGFADQVRLGCTAGNQWEPAIASDDFGHVYVLYPQYSGVPGCSTCPSPTLLLQISNDGGSTWAKPAQIAPPGTGQVDAQIVIDPLDGRTVYAAWLQNEKSDTVVAKSTDYGLTWTVAIADHTNAGTDKPILAVRGQDVYVGFNHAQKVWVSSSHDGGEKFASVNVNRTGKLGWSLAGGGTVDSAGNVYFSWAGYEQNGGAKGRVNLYVSKSTDGGATWTSKLLDVSGAPPDCSDYLCGWAYLGAQITLASNQTGTLYSLWNSGTVDKGPERIFFSKSIDQGVTWSEKADISAAPMGVHHAFPVIAAGKNGDVRISWMDSRSKANVGQGLGLTSVWNSYYRSSTSAGNTWSNETDISSFVDGYKYFYPEGFRFPFGDYYEMSVDGQGNTHVIMGQGANYDSPGSIWYTRGK